MTFGEKLKAARIKRGLTATELGKLTGLSQQAISMYENGDRRTPLPVAKQALARVLHVKPEDLDDDKEETTENE